MKKLLNIILAIALVCAGVVGAAQPTYADEGEEDNTPEKWIGLSPAALRVTIKSGTDLYPGSYDCPEDSSQGCAVEVKNLGTKDFRFKIYVTPYIVSGENYDLSFSESDSTSYTQISRWISFLDDNGEYADEVYFDLAAGESRWIFFRISVPEDIPGGAQYAAIWAQTVDGDASAGVSATSRAGTIIYGRSIGTTRQTAEITDYHFDRFTFGGPLHASATINNTGNTDFTAYYTYTVRTIFGKELYTDPRTIPTYPETEYHVSNIWENTPFLGLFQVEYTIESADTIRSERHLVLIMPVFVLILLILLLTVIITWIIIISRKRKERKARTLV